MATLTSNQDMRIKSKVPFTILILILGIFLIGPLQQGLMAQVAINTVGNPPNPKAMLDISSPTKGLLIPRMTTAGRTIFESSLTSSEKGMLVFDTETNTFYYYNGTAFDSISNGVIAVLQDADHDTKVVVEETPDADEIVFVMGGSATYKMLPTRLEPPGSNVALGAKSLYNNTGIGYLVAIGDSALYNNGIGATGSQGTRNTAVGSKAMFSNTTGLSNSAFGYQSMKNNTSGWENTAVGHYTLNNNTSGGRNIAIGPYSLLNNITGNGNIAVGKESLGQNESGEYNVAVGDLAMYLQETGNCNVAIGTKALFMNDGKSNIVAIGDSALFNNGTGASLDYHGTQNTATGSKSMYNNTTGYHNTVNGFNSMYSNTYGYENTAFGTETLYGNSGGHGNTAIGYQALYVSNFANYNTALGHSSLTASTSGMNTSVGAFAMEDNISGAYNTVLGYSALQNNTSGNSNICIGYKSGDNISSGDRNIVIGYDIDNYSSTSDERLNIGNLIFGTDLDGTGSTISSGNIGIGTKSPAYKLDVYGDMQLKSTTNNVTILIDAASSSGNSEIQFQEANYYRGAIGYNTDLNYMYFYEGGNMVLDNGNLGIGTTSPAYRLQVGTAGDGSQARANTWNTFSDISLKKDFSVIDRPLDKIKVVNGYYYYWKEGEDPSRQVGIVAQEIEAIMPEIVSTDPDGIKSVDYSKLTPLLIEAIKAQQEQIDAQNEKIRMMEAKLDSMQ